MATGYIVSGRGDLDDLFRARSSAAIANTNFRSNGGVDLAQRFEPRGSTAAIANTNFRAGANDLAQLFMGINAWVVSLFAHEIADDQIQPSAALASYALDNSGDIRQSTTGATNVDIGDWVTPKSAAPGTFQCRATLVSGSIPTTGTMNTWEALTTARSWSRQQNTNGTSTSVILVEIRDGTGPTLASANITLRATRTIS
jgi:hypothetical protein